MRRFALSGGLALGLALLAGCSSETKTSGASATARPLLAAQRGKIMPLANALREIAFKPYVPSSRPIAVAAIASLGGEDKRETRGIAFEYARGGDALLLSEWPRQHFHVAVPCAPRAFKPDGALWATRTRNLVMTLQSDGASATSVNEEARRLVTSGACF